MGKRAESESGRDTFLLILFELELDRGLECPTHHVKLYARP